MPGDMALAKRSKQLKEGVELFDTIIPNLIPYSEKLGVSLPKLV
jgi:hypothetical protein